MARGDYRELAGTWEGVTAAAASGDRIYVASGGSLFVLDPAEDSWEQLDGAWDLRGLVPIGDSFLGFDGGGAVFRMERDGRWEGLDASFPELRVAIGAGGKAYAVGESVLFEIDLGGNLERLEGSWDPAAVASVGASIFLAQTDGELFRLEPGGEYRQLEGTYVAPTAMTGHSDGRLYLVSDRSLYDIDPATGRGERISDGWDTTHLVSCGGTLYAFSVNGTLYAVDV